MPRKVGRLVPVDSAYQVTEPHAVSNIESASTHCNHIFHLSYIFIPENVFLINY
jgi:hypothetical protein